METIERTIEEFRAMVQHAGAATPSVSGWTVGEHVHHCCLSMIGIGKSLRKSTPPPPRAKPSLARSIVLLGYIPRGRAQSPSFVVPKLAVPQEELLAMLDQSTTLLAMAGTLDSGAWFTHPQLGTMNRDHALKFVLVHNRHHLKIVHDILTPRRR